MAITQRKLETFLRLDRLTDACNNLYALADDNKLVYDVFNRKIQSIAIEKGTISGVLSYNAQYYLNKNDMIDDMHLDCLESVLHAVNTVNNLADNIRIAISEFEQTGSDETLYRYDVFEQFDSCIQELSQLVDVVDKATLKRI